MMKHKAEDLHENFNKQKNSNMGVKQLYSSLWQWFEQCLHDAKIIEAIDKISTCCLNNPVLFIISLLLISTIILPIFLFVVIVVVNVAFAFIGFIIVEVSVLLISAAVLGSIFFLIISTVAISGLFFIVTYFIVYYTMLTVRNIKLIAT